MYKICQVVFSTNRLEYLKPTLESQQTNLDYSGCEVHKIFFDDYPTNRNDAELIQLASQHGFNEFILHKKNQGLSATWSECWRLLRLRDYDFIFQHEDDVKFLEPIKMLDLVEFYNENKWISNICLARQAWYHHEKDPGPTDQDIIYKDFRVNKINSNIFGILASFFSSKILNFPIKEFANSNLNEGIVGLYLYQLGMMPAVFKNKEGKQLVEHIGEWFVGKRVLENEPGYEQFKMFDPNKKYYSRNGQVYPE
jgi:hypothetical protein